MNREGISHIHQANLECCTAKQGRREFLKGVIGAAVSMTTLDRIPAKAEAAFEVELPLERAPLEIRRGYELAASFSSKHGGTAGIEKERISCITDLNTFAQQYRLTDEMTTRARGAAAFTLDNAATREKIFVNLGSRASNSPDLAPFVWGSALVHEKRHILDPHGRTTKHSEAYADQLAFVREQTPKITMMSTREPMKYGALLAAWKQYESRILAIYNKFVEAEKQNVLITSSDGINS